MKNENVKRGKGLLRTNVCAGRRNANWTGRRRVSVYVNINNVEPRVTAKKPGRVENRQKGKSGEDVGVEWDAKNGCGLGVDDRMWAFLGEQ